MLRAIEKLPARRYLLAALAAVCAMGLFAGKAAALTPPTLGITMTHLNAYGAEASECGPEGALKKGKAEPLAEPACGVDPLTETEASDKGETFARESGSNIYTITVTNHGEEATKGTVTVEDQLPKEILLGAEQEQLEFSAPGWSCKPQPTASDGGVHDERNEGRRSVLQPDQAVRVRQTRSGKPVGEPPDRDLGDQSDSAG